MATAALGPLVALVTGLPLWAGLLVSGAVVFGVPLFANGVVARFSEDWADLICEAHMTVSGLVIVGPLVAMLIFLVWRWVAA